MRPSAASHAPRHAARPAGAPPPSSSARRRPGRRARTGRPGVAPGVNVPLTGIVRGVMSRNSRRTPRLHPVTTRSPGLAGPVLLHVVQHGAAEAGANDGTIPGAFSAEPRERVLEHGSQFVLVLRILQEHRRAMPFRADVGGLLEERDFGGATPRTEFVHDRRRILHDQSLMPRGEHLHEHLPARRGVGPCKIRILKVAQRVERTTRPRRARRAPPASDENGRPAMVRSGEVAESVRCPCSRTPSAG